MKICKTGSVARNELIKGADALAEMVKPTCGPFGTNVFLEKGHRITNDGVSIASEVELEDETQNKGAYILREAATRTNDKAGDGTTSAIILAQAILKEAVRYMGDDEKGKLAQKTPAELISQIQKEKQEVLEKLSIIATPIETEEQLINSAIVSVENEELGKMIGSAQWELGKDGYLIAEESAERDCKVEKVSGIKIDNGLGTTRVINNQEKQSLELEDVPVFMTNHTIQTILPLKPIYEQLYKQGSGHFVIMAKAFSDQAIFECMENAKNGYLIAPINAPYTDQAEIMKDLASVLGATFYDQETHMLEDAQLSDVGFASKLVAKRWEAIITGRITEQTQQLVDKRVEELKDKLAGEVSDYEKRNLGQRISQLTNGFSVIKIGGISETERKYLKDKADDAVNAVRAAYQEGVVPGAGLAFKNIAKDLPDTYILKRPLQAINDQIMSTAPNGWVVPEWVKDPVKVLRIALDEACSVAGHLATAHGAIVSERPNKYADLFNKIVSKD